MRQLALDLVEPSPPSLNRFVAGRNHELLSLLGEVADNRARETCLYIWGERGVGKTYLLRALARVRGVFIDGAHGLQLDRVPDLLAIDDLDALDEPGLQALFNAYNEMRAAGGVIVASGPRPPAELAIRSDLATRLAWGLVFQVHPLSDDDKAAALRDRAAELGLALSGELVAYLLNHWSRDLASLLAALDAIDRYSLENKRPVTLPLIRSAIATPRP